MRAPSRYPPMGWGAGLCSWSLHGWSGAWVGLRSCGSESRDLRKSAGAPRSDREMTASKRVAKELEDLLEKLPPYLRDLSSDDANVLVWHMLLLPDQPPYHLKAFRLQIDFPREYPLKPPTLKFITKIYHPNISEDGLVCLPLISIENWKPYTKTCQVLEALNMLVSRPNPEEPVRLELADLLTQNPEMFRQKAEEFTLQFGEDRPS